MTRVRFGTPAVRQHQSAGYRRTKLVMEHNAFSMMISNNNSDDAMICHWADVYNNAHVQGPAYAVAWHWDGVSGKNRIASGGRDKIIRIWSD